MGYVLATHYVDQLSGSVINVFTLQCWAASLPGNVKVVEPFLHFGSLFGLQLDPTKPKMNKGNSNQDDVENTVKLFDLYDKKMWVDQEVLNSYADMDSWEYFLLNSPKKLILVDKLCSNNGKCMACGERNFFESDLFLKSANNFAEFYNFSIVRKACYKHRLYTEEGLKDIVYGNHRPDEVVVIFNRFGGFAPHGNILRINLFHSDCYRGPHFNMIFTVHKNIKKQAREYIKQFMPNTDTTGYVSVAFRTEQFAISNHFTLASKTEQLKIMNYCVNKLANTAKKYKRWIRTSSIFFSTDAGKFGSAAFRKIDPNNFNHDAILKYPGSEKLKKNTKKYYFHEDVLETGLIKLHKLLYGKVVPLHKRIESIVSNRSPGYIALLEMTLTANATCVVLAGGGEFHTRIMKFHTIMKSSLNCIEELSC